MPAIKIKLTKKQLELLTPLFDLANEKASQNRTKGSIFMQPYDTGIAHAKFIPHNKALKIIAITKTVKG